MNNNHESGMYEMLYFVCIDISNIALNGKWFYGEMVCHLCFVFFETCSDPWSSDLFMTTNYTHKYINSYWTFTNKVFVFINIINFCKIIISTTENASRLITTPKIMIYNHSKWIQNYCHTKQIRQRKGEIFEYQQIITQKISYKRSEISYWRHLSILYLMLTVLRKGILSSES